jgi:hypothetical protein
MRYLEVKFHDNDFHQDFLHAVKKIWDWVVSDFESHSLQENRRSVVDSFVLLHKEYLLETMVQKMILLSALNHDVEWATRGLYRNDDMFGSRVLKTVTTEAYHLQEYFSKVEIEFHDTLEFADKNENAEHIWFDLKNGNCGCF